MKKILLASLLAFGLTASAIASEDGSGAYIGLGYGTTTFDKGDAPRLNDDSDSGYKVYGGYLFNKVVGVEAAYTDYGDYTYITNTTLSPTAISIAANLGYTFLNGQLRPYALAGLSYLDLNQNRTAYYDDDNTVAFAYGAGIEYSPTILKGLGFRASWNADIYVVDPIITDDYTQTLGMLNVSVQYKF